MNTDLQPINVFWFRRDLRLEDNRALSNALKGGLKVLPLFIVDTEITGELSADDSRITFIFEALESLNEKLKAYGGSVLVMKGKVLSVWKILADTYKIISVYINRDYEPYAVSRDRSVEKLLGMRGISLMSFKDHVMFEEKEIISEDNNPYKVFTAYKRKWLKSLNGICPPGEFDFPADRNSFVP